MRVNIEINGENWLAYETGVGDSGKPERKWWFASPAGSKLRLVGFYAASLDEGVSKVWRA